MPLEINCYIAFDKLKNYLAVGAAAGIIRLKGPFPLPFAGYVSGYVHANNAHGFRYCSVCLLTNLKKIKQIAV